MTVNLIKLCVGAESIEDLDNWVRERLAAKKARGIAAEQTHTTRMMPKRLDEILDGGSLYWVIKGSVQCRQEILDIRPFTDAEGISRCDIVLKPVIVPTFWQPRRAFQGWRYLDPKDAPADLDGRSGVEGLPPELRIELAGLGLL